MLSIRIAAGADICQKRSFDRYRKILPYATVSFFSELLERGIGGTLAGLPCAGYGAP